jgi:hypothetical protein
LSAWTKWSKARRALATARVHSDVAVRKKIRIFLRVFLDEFINISVLFFRSPCSAQKIKNFLLELQAFLKNKIDPEKFMKLKFFIFWKIDPRRYIKKSTTRSLKLGFLSIF